MWAEPSAVQSEHLSRAMPRFIFLTDQAASRPARQGGDSAVRVAWRILAANNRAMGRSVGVFDSLEDCLAAASRLREEVETLTYAITSAAGTARWSWVVRSGGSSLAVSAHKYQRRIECVRGVRQFMTAIRVAVPSIHEVRHIGVRSFGIYEPLVDVEPPLEPAELRLPAGAPITAIR
ncbi:MAG: hypothetical protein QOK10_3778 [Pseudonocardiales bacterium]|jgi:hypothetical protein|nr:hypothetical protein [Pseudonocardiales bacterium]